MTSDGATLEMGAEVYYQVCDPVKSVSCVQDIQNSTRSLCQVALQKLMPRFSLMQCQSDQQGIANTFKVIWFLAHTEVPSLTLFAYDIHRNIHSKKCTSYNANLTRNRQNFFFFFFLFLNYYKIRLQAPKFVK